MNENVIKKVYEGVKKNFEGVDKNSWIWVDYFEDEDGYEYFKESCKDDVDVNMNDDDIENLVEDITDQLKENDFISSLLQSSFY